MNQTSKAVIEVQDLRSEFKMGETVVHALNSVSLGVNRGEFVGVLGPSGSVIVVLSFSEIESKEKKDT